MLKPIKLNDRSFIFSCVAAILSAAALAAFLAAPGDYRSPVVVAVVTLAAIIANAAYVFYRDAFGFLPTAASALCLASLVIVIASQLNNIAMLVTGVGLGNSGIPAAFWISAVCYAAAIVLSGVNVFAKRV